MHLHKHQIYCLQQWRGICQRLPGWTKLTPLSAWTHALAIIVDNLLNIEDVLTMFNAYMLLQQSELRSLVSPAAMESPVACVSLVAWWRWNMKVFVKLLRREHKGSCKSLCRSQWSKQKNWRGGCGWFSTILYLFWYTHACANVVRHRAQVRGVFIQGQNLLAPQGVRNCCTVVQSNYGRTGGGVWLISHSFCLVW